MSDNSKIEWTETTWNIVTGCTKISDGCTRCYIERTPPFRMNGRRFDKPGIGGTTGVILHDDRLTAPLRWRKPRRVFVCSLADLFHTAVPTRYIARAFAVMVIARQHTFQVLTKRHARLRALLTDQRFWQMVATEIGVLRNIVPPAPLRQVPPWIWVGVSVESQEWADRRIPALLSVPAAVRWLSCEPLIGPVDLHRWLDMADWPDCWNTHAPSAECSRCVKPDWVVVGGESGPNARLMREDWARGLVQQLGVAEGPVFVKQMGTVWARERGIADPKGGDMQHWPADLRIRQYPTEPGVEVAW